MHLSVNLFVYSFLQWFHCSKLINIYTLNKLCMIIWCLIVLICSSAQLAEAFQLTKIYFIKMFSLYTVIVSCVVQLFIILTTSNLLQITELEQATSKYSERWYICLKNYYCNLNWKFNHLFHSLNIIEYTLGCQCISVTSYLLQIYSSKKPLFKGQGAVNLSFKQHRFGRINYRVYMRRSKRLD